MEYSFYCIYRTFQAHVALREPELSAEGNTVLKGCKMRILSYSGLWWSLITNVTQMFWSINLIKKEKYSYILTNKQIKLENKGFIGHFSLALGALSQTPDGWTD